MDASVDAAVTELVRAVEPAFVSIRGDLTDWDDPHPERDPPDDQYSRVSDPGKYRIVGARADAWARVLIDTGLAVVESGGTVTWRTTPGAIITHTDVLVPTASGALPLVLSRSALGGVPDAGLTVGVGSPAVLLEVVPDCGCDACDSGSQDLIDVVDSLFRTVVSGAFRHLSRRDREIFALHDGRRARGRFGRNEVEARLADPTGWDETAGAPWVQPAAS